MRRDPIVAEDVLLVGWAGGDDPVGAGLDLDFHVDALEALAGSVRQDAVPHPGQRVKALHVRDLPTVGQHGACPTG